jgi:addiction module RelE/StbE family toxin
MFSIKTTQSFEKQLKKFIRRNSNLKKKIADVLIQLEKDPFYPKLKLHPLKGKLAGLHAVSITFNYRLTFIIQIAPKEITLMDIGTHDQVYRQGSLNRPADLRKKKHAV